MIYPARSQFPAGQYVPHTSSHMFSFVCYLCPTANSLAYGPTLSGFPIFGNFGHLGPIKLQKCAEAAACWPHLTSHWLDFCGGRYQLCRSQPHKGETPYNPHTWVRTIFVVYDSWGMTIPWFAGNTQVFSPWQTFYELAVPTDCWIAKSPSRL